MPSTVDCSLGKTVVFVGRKDRIRIRQGSRWSPIIPGPNGWGYP